MAEGGDVKELLGRVLEANARLYRGWVDLSLDYLRDVTQMLDPEQTSSDTSAEGSEAVEEDAGALVLEGMGGESARAAFLLTNDLGRPLKCEPVASSFTGPDEAATRPKVSFEPKSVELAPGEQRVVQAIVKVGKRLPAGVAYTGAISIKGMDGFSVPVVLRRRDDTPSSPIDRAAAEEPESNRPAATQSPTKKRAPKKSAASRKRTAKKKTASKKRTVEKAEPRKRAAREAAPKKAAAKKRTPAKKAAAKKASRK